MILSKQAIKILEKDEKLRRKLAAELSVLDETIDNWVKKNDDNSRLTTVAALKMLETETGLTQSEILTDETHAVK